MVAASANELLALVGLLYILPLLLLLIKLRFLSKKLLRASSFLRFLVYGFSGLTMSFKEEQEVASDRLVNDLDLPA